MIQVTDLAKQFGWKRALGPVSFEIADGETVGFLGLNGAGKTTVLRLLACDLRPSAGSITVGGLDAVERPHEVRKLVGFLPESPPLYSDMTVRDYLGFAGRIRGMNAADVAARVPEVARVTHVDEVLGDVIRNLSHGFRQRVGVAQAIMHRPKLLILDEPTRGLDPVQIVEMRAMIRDLKQAHTVLISSHILPEISQTCDRLLVLGAGTIVGAGTEEQLSAQVVVTHRAVVGVQPTSAREAIIACLREVTGVTDVAVTGEDGDTLMLELAAATDVRAAAAKALVDQGHAVVKLDEGRQLEDVFMKLVKGTPHARN
jgi:ABC-2 type transport system ATP-binding protein